MVATAAQDSPEIAQHAAQLALLVQERGAGGFSIDLDERLAQLRAARDRRSQHLLKLSGTLAKAVSHKSVESDGLANPSSGLLLSRGLADRIAQRRGSGPGGMIRFRLANGRGAEIEASEQLASEDFLVVIDMAGRAGAARILSAAALSKLELLSEFEDQIVDQVETSFDSQTGALSAMKVSKLGAIAPGYIV